MDEDLEKKLKEVLRSCFEDYKDRLKEEVKNDIIEGQKIDVDELAKTFVSLIDLDKLNEIYENDELHKQQHEWIKLQIEKEKRINDLIWNTKGAAFAFLILGFFSSIGWGLIKFIEQIAGK